MQNFVHRNTGLFPLEDCTAKAECPESRRLKAPTLWCDSHITIAIVLVFLSSLFESHVRSENQAKAQSTPPTPLACARCAEYGTATKAKARVAETADVLQTYPGENIP